MELIWNVWILINPYYYYENNSNEIIFPNVRKISILTYFKHINDVNAFAKFKFPKIKEVGLYWSNSSIRLLNQVLIPIKNTKKLLIKCCEFDFTPILMLKNLLTLEIQNYNITNDFINNMNVLLDRKSLQNNHILLW